LKKKSRVDILKSMATAGQSKIICIGVWTASDMDILTLDKRSCMYDDDFRAKILFHTDTLKIDN